MKKEDIFEGAIVLARSSIYERRSRWKVLEVGDSLVKVKKDNLTMYTGIRHLRPAKITRKSLKECGFVEYRCLGCKIKCLHYKGTDVQILLEDCYCQYKVGRPGVVLSFGNARQVPPPRKSQPLKYMHEVQKEIKKLGL